MNEKPQPDPVPEDEPPPHPAEPLKLTTPVIQVKEAGHNARIAPSMDGREESAMELDSAIAAMEELERSLHRERKP
jgi:hypothetical protein